MKFLVSIHRSNDFNHVEQIDAAVRQAINDLNDEMVAAGVRLFVGGLCSPSSAKAVHLQDGGDVMIVDGPFLETKEYVDGIWVLECATTEEAVEWGRKAALACLGSVEVRPFSGAILG